MNTELIADINERGLALFSKVSKIAEVGLKTPKTNAALKTHFLNSLTDLIGNKALNEYIEQGVIIIKDVGDDVIFEFNPYQGSGFNPGQNCPAIVAETDALPAINITQDSPADPINGEHRCGHAEQMTSAMNAAIYHVASAHFSRERGNETQNAAKFGFYGGEELGDERKEFNDAITDRKCAFPITSLRHVGHNLPAGERPAELALSAQAALSTSRSNIVMLIGDGKAMSASSTITMRHQNAKSTGSLKELFEVAAFLESVRSKTTDPDSIYDQNPTKPDFRSYDQARIAPTVWSRADMVGGSNVSPTPEFTLQVTAEEQEERLKELDQIKSSIEASGEFCGSMKISIDAEQDDKIKVSVENTNNLHSGLNADPGSNAIYTMSRLLSKMEKAGFEGDRKILNEDGQIVENALSVGFNTRDYNKGIFERVLEDVKESGKDVMEHTNSGNLAGVDSRTAIVENDPRFVKEFREKSTLVERVVLPARAFIVSLLSWDFSAMSSDNRNRIRAGGSDPFGFLSQKCKELGIPSGYPVFLHEGNPAPQNKAAKGLHGSEFEIHPEKIGEDRLRELAEHLENFGGWDTPSLQPELAAA